MLTNEKQVMLKEIMIKDSYKELLNRTNGMMYVMDNALS